GDGVVRPDLRLPPHASGGDRVAEHGRAGRPDGGAPAPGAPTRDQEARRGAAALSGGERERSTPPGRKGEGVCPVATHDPSQVEVDPPATEAGVVAKDPAKRARRGCAQVVLLPGAGAAPPDVQPGAVRAGESPQAKGDPPRSVARLADEKLQIGNPPRLASDLDPGRAAAAGLRAAGLHPAV